MNIKKNLDTILYIIITMLIIVHEYIKEKYLFKPSDILKFPTHESIILIITIIFIIYKITKKTAYGTI